MPPASLFLLFYFSLSHSQASVMSYLKRSVIYLRPPCFCQVDSVRAAGKKEIFQSIQRRNSTTKSQAYPFRRLIFNLFLFPSHAHLRFSSDMIWFGCPGWSGAAPPSSIAVQSSDPITTRWRKTWLRGGPVADGRKMGQNHSIRGN